MTGPELERAEMTKLHERIETTLPIDATVRLHRRLRELDARGIRASRPPSAIDAGPVGLGARYRLGVRMRGKVAPMEYRITTFEPPTRVVLTARAPASPRSTRSASSRPRPGRAIDYTADIRLGGWMRLVQPFLGGAFEKIAKDALGGMQRRSMSAPPGARPATTRPTEVPA